ncbi:transposase domain containing protein [Nephila pilipes]|uniref:Transposase domain containing protein n=1 Tax=Nephila pilipes TaxID=299642 RepID=A0A8X6JSM4_NEPPI|nr:transposase domain containing protein [Nephila pilipes]
MFYRFRRVERRQTERQHGWLLFRFLEAQTRRQPLLLTGDSVVIYAEERISDTEDADRRLKNNMKFEIKEIECGKKMELDAEFQLMSWPPNSPDLNPIEHIWDVMGRQLRVQRPPIRNISDLRDRCLNIWYNLSPLIYQGLVASMPRRVEAVLPTKEKYIENSIKNLLMNIIEERLEKNKEAEQVTEQERKKSELEAEQERRKAKMDFELQKLKLQLEAKKMEFRRILTLTSLYSRN